MNLNHLTLLLRVGVLLSSFFHATAFAAEQFHSASHGYHLDLPPGWVEIPKDVLQETFSAVQKENATTRIAYDAGFQLESAEHWLDYPYVLTQPILYATTAGLHRQINEDEFPAFVETMTGADVGELLDENISSDARDLIRELDKGEVQLDVARRRYFWPLDMEVQGIGPVRGLVVGYFGRESIVQVAFYSRQSDWDLYADSRRAIVESFRFDPDKAYSVEAASSSPPSWLRAMESGALVGAITGVIGALVAIGIVMRRRKSTSQPRAPEEDVR